MTPTAPRKAAWWMHQLDDRILEHLREESWSSVAVMGSRTAFRASEARIRERCRVLVRAGLIAPIYRQTYELTTWGSLYLKGKLDVNHWPRPPTRGDRR